MDKEGADAVAGVDGRQQTARAPKFGSAHVHEEEKVNKTIDHEQYGHARPLLDEGDLVGRHDGGEHQSNKHDDIPRSHHLGMAWIDQVAWAVYLLQRLGRVWSGLSQLLVRGGVIDAFGDELGARLFQMPEGRPHPAQGNTTATGIVGQKVCTAQA